ncbi:MAG: endonuclease/exonuclease/phosphatase [Deltaproteobacteria bacterium RBG_19FT_COMBO_43_11]|nr:MAG: endonuclease/exonuclease/phosphatase [Deltaproteobacteria bacterium RBG_19FT_COMBO_43_11]
MRLATFNVENMFERPKAMNLDTWADGKDVLDDFSRLNQLIQEPVYSDKIKAELIAIMKRNKGLLTVGQSKFIRLYDIRGKFLRKPRNKPVEIAAAGRGDWLGWFKLIPETVKEAATKNTARIIGLLKTDILCVIEAENRIVLKKFNEGVMPMVDLEPFPHVMLIDGNDERGIDVGIMTKKQYNIVRMLSHVDDKDDKDTIFSRDCAEYEIKTEKGNTLLLLVNHFKSKGYGKPAESAEKRYRQAKRVRALYNAHINAGYDYVTVLGDLNEIPDEYPMDPLIREGSTLTDIMAHPKFENDGRPGTHGNGTKSAKLDYILMSPKLSEKVIRGGVERCGVWGGEKGTLFPHLPEIVSKVDAASDHAALWVDVDI